MTELGFDNNGNIVVLNRAYRRKKIKTPILKSNLPKKKKRRKNK